MKIDENITMHQQDMQKVSVRQKVVKILVQVALYAFLILNYYGSYYLVPILLDDKFFFEDFG